MKKVIKTTIFFALAIMITKTSLAQKGLQLNMNNNIATPLGSSFRDYINKTSLGGLQVSVLYGITDHLSLGVQSGYSDFYQKHYKPFYNRYMVKSFPLLVKAAYSFFDKGYVKPYVGIGAGVNLVNYEASLSESGNQNNYTKAGFTGDVGVMIPLVKGSRYGFRVSTSYNLMPFNEQGIKNLNSWDVQAGVSIPLSN